MLTSLIGNGALINWLDVDPSDDDDFNDWYTNEHLVERVSIPGFLRGRRYYGEGQTVGAGRYFTIYETTDLDVLASAAYLERLNAPTPWTVATVSKLTLLNRSACRVIRTAGQGSAARVVAAPLTATSLSRSEVEAWFKEASETLLQRRDAVGVHLLESDEQTTRAKDATAEGASTSGAAPVTAWVLIVEPAHVSRTDAAVAAIRESAALAAEQFEADQVGVFDLISENISVGR